MYAIRSYYAHIGQLAQFTKIKSATVYGGVGMQPQVDALRRGVDIVVATPGRLLDHLRQPWASLRSVEVLVLDEADRMLDMGFLPEIKKILRHLPAKRQTALFSATMPRITSYNVCYTKLLRAGRKPCSS